MAPGRFRPKAPFRLYLSHATDITDHFMPGKKIFIALLTGFCRLASAQTTDLIDYSKVSETQVSVADVSNPTAPGKTFIAATVISEPVGKLCSAIMDYSAYPQFMPNTEKTSIVATGDESTVIEMTLKLPLGKTKKYRLKMDSAITPESCRLSWKLVPWGALQQSETITDTSGYWQLTSDPNDTGKTLVKYFVFADPGPIPFGLGWIVDLMTKISLPRTLEALRERVAVKPSFP